jgi:hypothetical protein
LRNAWKPIWYTSDLVRADRYTASMLQVDGVRAARVIDQEITKRLRPAKRDPPPAMLEGGLCPSRLY